MKKYQQKTTRCLAAKLVNLSEATADSPNGPDGASGPWYLVGVSEAGGVLLFFWEREVQDDPYSYDYGAERQGAQT